MPKTEEQFRMKILHLSAVQNWGGGEKQIENLCSYFQENFPEVKNLIFCSRNGWFHQRLLKTGLNFTTAPQKIKSDPRFVFKLLAYCKRENPDLIHIHDPTALMLAIMADKLGTLPPFVLSKKTSYPIKSRPRTLFKYNYPKIKSILCVSEATRRVAESSIKNPEKLKRVYHGMNIWGQEKLKPRFCLREKLEISSEKKIIGNIANHIRPKDLETLVKTADFLINSAGRNDVHFVQIGHFSGKTPSLKSLIGKYNLESNFSFINFQEDASAFIPQFDISILSSSSEGLPQFIFESFYYKVPVISTSVGGIPEIIGHAKNGLLAEAYDAKKLSENLLFLMDNAAMIPKFTEISYDKLMENFTSEKMAKNTLNEYKKILDERP